MYVSYIVCIYVKSHALISCSKNSDVMFVICNVTICYTYNYYYNKIIHVNDVPHREFPNVADGQCKDLFIIMYKYIINNTTTIILKGW